MTKFNSILFPLMYLIVTILISLSIKSVFGQTHSTDNVNTIREINLQNTSKKSFLFIGSERRITDVHLTRDKTEEVLDHKKKLSCLYPKALMTSLILLITIFVIIYITQRSNERKKQGSLTKKIEELIIEKESIAEKFNQSLPVDNKKIIDSLDDRTLKKIVVIIDAHLGDSLFGVDKLASEMGMSRTNLHRKIKKITGLPPSELIRSIRMKKAASLLLNHENTVSQIAFIVGFEDQSYFSKSFKKQFGLPPKEYIKSQSVN
jgi:AraC-like DNA-binding protein